MTAGHWIMKMEVYMDQLEDSAYTVNVIDEKGKSGLRIQMTIWRVRALFTG